MINNGAVVSGFELKYDGIVDLLRSHLEKLVLQYQPVNDIFVTKALSRFARAVLNVGNR